MLKWLSEKENREGLGGLMAISGLGIIACGILYVLYSLLGGLGLMFGFGAAMIIFGAMLIED